MRGVIRPLKEAPIRFGLHENRYERRVSGGGIFGPE